ncbi:hypothetical protein [Streptomyces rishiriensis]|uniref:hypothetical protein n=1 Tax=Streptomyces rishiriensis TaxID=68264 RepID=UPI0037CF8A2D
MAEGAATGVADAARGEVLEVYVDPRPGASGRTGLAEELRGRTQAAVFAYEARLVTPG